MSLALDLGAMGVALVSRADPRTGCLTLSAAEVTTLFQSFVDFTARAAELEAEPVPVRLRGAVPVRPVRLVNVF
jgi:hypothetical protein